MARKFHRSGSNVSQALAGARHIRRMTSVLVPAAASEPRLPRGPALAPAGRTCDRGSGDECFARTVSGCAPRRPALLAIHAWALLVLVPFGSTAAHAEPAGRMGVTSRATVQISVSVAPRLDVNRSGVTAVESGGGEGRTEGLCIWSNTSIQSYSISASDASDGSGGERFPFEVQLAGAGAGANAQSLAPGASATGLTAGSGNACRSGRLVIRPAQMASGTAAVHRSGALLLLIAPD